VTAADIVREACGSRFTAAVLRVERGGAVVSERAFGSVDDSPGAAAIDVTTRFDLASLTKLFVAGAALRAVAAGTLDLDAPLLDVVPEWKGRPQAAITLRMLLAHTSGMQSGADYRTLGERVIYSDLGFIALGVVLARGAGRGLPAVLARSNAAFGANDAVFRPTVSPRGAIPATELDLWRGRVRATVHDEKAHLLNGIAGHAGLFGTAADVAALTEAFLAPATARGASSVPAWLAPALPAGLARESVVEQGADPVLRRGLGWALKTSDANSCGPAMSRATFGHTGFTGTSVWADPVRDLSIVLLTNAVYFGRNDLRDVRAAVCTAVVEEADRCARSA
jgi:CubicO group peptidase (beta-lactamase class C family)